MHYAPAVKSFELPQCNVGALGHHRGDRLPDACRPVRNPGYFAIARQALQCRAILDRLRRQCQHDRNGRLLPRRGLDQPSPQSQAGHLDQPCSAGNSHIAFGGRARPPHIRGLAGCAGRVHGLGLHADHGLSCRKLQRQGNRQRSRGLYHRRRGQQSGGPPGFRNRGRPARIGLQLLSVCSPQSGGRGPGVRQSRPHAADGQRRTEPVTAAELG